MRKAKVDELFAKDTKVSLNGILTDGLVGYNWAGDLEAAKAKKSVEDLIDALPTDLTYRALLLEPWPEAGSGGPISTATAKVEPYFAPGYGKYRDAIAYNDDRTLARKYKLPHRGIAKDLIDGWPEPVNPKASGFATLFTGKTLMEALQTNTSASTGEAVWKYHIVQLCRKYSIFELTSPWWSLKVRSRLVNNKCASWNGTTWSCSAQTGTNCEGAGGPGDDLCGP